jgi:hypothetical protein
MARFLELRHQKLDVGEVVVGVAVGEVERLIGRHDDAPRLSADLSDNAAVDLVLVAAQPVEVLNDDRRDPALGHLLEQLPHHGRLTRSSPLRISWRNSAR